MAIAYKFREDIYINGTDFTDEEFIDMIFPSLSPRKLYNLSFTYIDCDVFSIENLKGKDVPSVVFILKRCPSVHSIVISPKYERKIKK